MSGDIKNCFQNAQKILVVSHVRPDGDAIGSLLGLGLALKDAGKDVQMVLADGVPANFRFLDGADLVRKSAKGPVDLAVAVDASELDRVGNAFRLDGTDTPLTPDVNIDHHITNTNFARYNLIEAEAAATAEILTRWLPEWGLAITPAVANALLTGLVTDTLGFRTSSTTPTTMRMGADLMEAGGNLPETYFQSLVSRSFEAASFWGSGLAALQREGPMIWTTLTQNARKASGYGGNDDADLINVLTAIEGAAVAMIFVEQPHNKVKISWRGKPGWDVSQIAMKFGGGGHRAAAGADVDGSMDEVIENVLAATRTLFVGG